MVEDEAPREDRELLYPLLKAHIGADVYGKGAYQYIYNRHFDLNLTTAIELLKDQSVIEDILQAEF